MSVRLPAVRRVIPGLPDLCRHDAKQALCEPEDRHVMFTVEGVNTIRTCRSSRFSHTVKITMGFPGVGSDVPRDGWGRSARPSLQTPVRHEDEVNLCGSRARRDLRDRDLDRCRHAWLCTSAKAIPARTSRTTIPSAKRSSRHLNTAQRSPASSDPCPAPAPSARSSSPTTTTSTATQASACTPQHPSTTAPPPTSRPAAPASSSRPTPPTPDGSGSHPSHRDCPPESGGRARTSRHNDA
jgi:hypothetical protein